MILSCSSFLTLSLPPGISAGVMSLPWQTSFNSLCSSFRSRYLPYAIWHLCHACHTIADELKVLHCVCTVSASCNRASVNDQALIVSDIRLTTATSAAPLCFVTSPIEFEAASPDA